MIKKLFETQLNGITITVQLTKFAQSAIAIITESAKLQVVDWKIGMQTPFEPLPTVITLRETVPDETHDNMVRAISKRTKLPVLVSLNLPRELASENNIILGKLIADQLNNLKLSS